jgi:hypothetical protein
MDGNGAMRDQPQPRIPQHQAPQPTIPHVAEAPEADEQPSLPIAAQDSAQPVISESPKDETKEEPAAGEPDGGRRRRRRYPAAAANGATRAASTEASSGNGKAIDVPDDGRSSDEALA